VRKKYAEKTHVGFQGQSAILKAVWDVTRGTPMNLTGHMMLTSGSKSVNHRCMIREYVVDMIPSIFMHILKNLFVSISPNFKTSYYELSTCLHCSMIFKPKLTILHVKIVKIGRINIHSNRH